MSKARGDWPRRDFLRSLLLGAAAVPFYGCSCLASSGRRPPNIIFVLADDLGYGDLSCFGQKRFQTPHMDRMAGEGVRFTQCYAGSPVCAPSRNSLLAGRHTGRTPVRMNRGEGRLHEGDPSVAALLGTAGYKTAVIGKWGIGKPHPEAHPNRQGFDLFYGCSTMEEAHHQYTEYLWENDRKVRLKEGERFAHDRIVEKALAFIEENRREPFFLWLTPTLPHPDLVAPEEELRRFRGRFPETPFQPEEEDKEGETYAAQETPRAAYAALVTILDRDVGRLLTFLENLGLAEETVVFLSSDNGAGRAGGLDPEFFGSHGPFQGRKRTLYEGGIRVPLIAWGPGQVGAGRETGHVCALWDFLPTAAEIAGAPVPWETDGLSVMPALTGRTGAVHDYLYWEIYHPLLEQAIRVGRWKGMRGHRERPIQLFDLASDPGEKVDLAAEHPDVVDRMATLMDEAHTEIPLSDVLG